jgi:hypothetical protein
MNEIIEIVGTALVTIIRDQIKAGKSRKDAEAEAARAVLRGDVVSDELYDRLEKYIASTKDFEDNG